MDALLALREAIVHGAPIVERGESLVINDGTDEAVTLARSTKTPFKSSGGGHYTIDALWMQYLYKDLRHADFWKEYDKRGVSRVGAVIVSDKESVLLYLQGQYDGADHIDREFVSTTSGVTRVPASHGIVPSTSSGSGGAAGAVGADKVPNDAVAAQAAAYAAIRAEKPLRTRTSILDAPGFKNFGEIVFEFFKHQDAATTGGAGKPGSGAKRSRDKDGPSGGESKYPRVEGNPIIIVPNAPTSMITLHNVRDLLEKGTYVPPAIAKTGSTGLLSSVTISHPVVSGGSASTSATIPAQFDVIDSVSKLTPQDWPRVVAVFALGPEWQFKGWTLGKPPGTPIRPVDVFAFALTFHLKLDDAAPHENIAKWPVATLNINKSKRHLDVVAVNKFWGMLDAYMLSKRQYMLTTATAEEE